MLSYVDTQLFKSAENIDQVKHAINADLKKVDVWYEFNQTREIIQNIKQLLLEGSREILCWPVKEPLSVFKMNWNSLASLDSKLKFEGQMCKICRKVSQLVAVLNRL